MKPDNIPNFCTGCWSSQQYTKIQDFVIYGGLYRGQPSNLSHADIVIALAKEALENRAHGAKPSIHSTPDTHSKPEKPIQDTQTQGTLECD